MKRSILLLSTIITILSASGTASSTIWQVHPDSTLSSIQAGIDSSSHGDTVLVYPETYVENIDFNAKKIVLGSLFLTTGDTSYVLSTIIDGDSSGTVVTFQSGEDSTVLLTGFTIRNGFGWMSGGGVACYSSSNPRLTNLVISGNFGMQGGGVFCWSNSSPSLVNLTISGNRGGFGGGIYCYGNSCPSLIGVSISENSIIRFVGSGGGIYCSGSSPTLTNVTISGNSVTSIGPGGGITCIASNPVLTNVAIIGNTAAGSGGGIYSRSSNLSLTNVTITENAADFGGGVFFADTSSSSLVNCILWNDSPEEVSSWSLYYPNTIAISYSDIEGGSAGIVTDDSTTVYWLEGNIDEDPLFVGSGKHPLSLQEDSPCIDVGTPDTAGLNLPPWDIIGNVRIWDGDGNGSAIIDMGAYEYGAPAVGIDDKVVVEPTTHVLLGNRPNPFNVRTAIQYTLPEDRKVSLKVCNLLGQEIRELVVNFQQSGMYSLIWNGRDDSGRRVPSGPYFLRLEAGEYTATRKVCVVR